MANIKRNPYFTPAMQQAYLSAVSKNKSSGYVNAEARARKQLGGAVRSESERLYGLDRAGEQREMAKQFHEDRMKMETERLDAIEDATKISSLLGVGQLGLGLWNSYKDRQSSRQQEQFKQNELSSTLNYLRQNNPRMYDWYISQPNVRNYIDKYNINLPSVKRYDMNAMGIPSALGY